MAEKPILFSAPMVRALLAGTKTQTRRVVALPRSRDSFVLEDHGDGWWPYESDDGESSLCNDGMEHPYVSPYGQPGDRLRVKEAAWMWCERRPDGTTKTGHAKWLYVPMRGAGIWYAADHRSKPNISVVSPDTGNEWGWRLKIGRFLPAWASRIMLEITDVRVERLQDISEADAEAEGVHTDPACPAYDAYAALWDQINGLGAWDANPWVWAVTFQIAVPNT